MKRVELYFGEADSRFGGCCFQAGWAERSVLSLLFVSDQKLSFTSSSTNEMVTLQLGPNMLRYFSTRVFSRIIEYLDKKGFLTGVCVCAC